MITTENITSHELIGMQTEIVNASNPHSIGLNGRVVDETKSMIRIHTKTGIKSIPKVNSELEFTVSNNKIIVNGTKISKRPYDRIGGKV